MAISLPPLRLDLDILPSPDASRPGLLLRDPYQYSSATLLVPPLLISGLRLFDGERSLSDLQSDFASVAGVTQADTIADSLYHALDQAGFLENGHYREMKARREDEFAQAETRGPAFAGSAYPDEPHALSGLMSLRVGAAEADGDTVGIAAPHASPDGGWGTYRAAYRSMPREKREDRTFIILGTSHYGAPECFGLTRKPFVTPLGQARTDVRLAEELERAAPQAVRMEDYCHAIEHSIELQIIFLQHLYGPDVRILPILCGPFVHSIVNGNLPEDDPHLRRFFDALGNIGVREGRRLFWILGVDMAHIGARYGDPQPVLAEQDRMLQVRERDHQRIEQLTAGDARAYWNLIQENRDDLRWCGSAPLYTFLKALPQVRGKLLNYHQWQIDPGSVVSFAALHFA